MNWLQWLSGVLKPRPPVPQPPAPPQLPPPTPQPASVVVERLLTLHNQARNARGIGPLVRNMPLDTDATRHATWMATNRNMSHREVPGTPGFTAVNYQDRMKAAGYGGFYDAGENVAAGQQTADAVMTDWMNSPGHYANIVDKDYKDVGFGVAADRHGVLYWCVVFGSRGRTVEIRGLYDPRGFRAAMEKAAATSQEKRDTCPPAIVAG